MLSMCFLALKIYVFNHLVKKRQFVIQENTSKITFYEKFVNTFFTILVTVDSNAHLTRTFELLRYLNFDLKNVWQFFENQTDKNNFSEFDLKCKIPM